MVLETTVGRRDGREVILRAALVAAGFLATAAIVGTAEIALRLLDPDLLVRRRGIHRYHPDLGWEARPGVRWERDGVATTLGSRGERLSGSNLPPGQSRSRLRLFGDSVVFGLGVSDHETLAAWLARDPPGYDVINRAVQGYGPGQTLLSIEKTRFNRHGGTVVFGLCLGNDLADIVSTHHLYDENIPKPRFVLRNNELRLEAAPAKGQWRRHLLDRSFLLARLAPSAEGRPSDSREVARRLQLLRESSPEAEDTLVAIVRRMRTLAEGRGARFVVAAFPDARVLERTSLRWVRLRPKLLSVADLLDLAPVLAPTREDYALNTLDHIGHLSARGHQLAAEAIARHLSGGSDALRSLR